jgi:hypothetical protein
LVVEAVWGIQETRDAVTEINKFSNFLGYQQGLQEGFRLPGEGKQMSDAAHYDLEAKIKLNATSESFNDVEFEVVSRVVSLEEAPVQELPLALERAINRPIKDPTGGGDEAGEKAGGDHSEGQAP